MRRMHLGGHTVGALLLGFALFCLLLIAPKTSAAVVGIDFGSELSKVGIATLGRPFEIVLNLRSNRKTPNVVSFVEPTREFGEPAQVHASKQPSDVLLLAPRLLGLNTSAVPNPLDSIVNPFFPINVSHDEDRGSIKIHLTKRNVTLVPEEIAANLLQFIRRAVGNFLASPTRLAPLDAIITVPSLFNMRQRQALLDAASIANVNVLSLVRETPASALHHARDLPTNYTGTKLFINMGASHTEACVVSYNITTIKRRNSSTHIVACDVTDRVGGRQLDLLLADVVAKQAAERFNIKELPPRALQRVLSQAQKSKLVLSANKKTDLFIEGLYEEKDFRVSITREELEQFTLPQIPVIEQLIDNVVQQAGFKKEQLNGVEVVGAAWRVPKIQQELGRIVKPHELGQHVNGDEGAALGATLIAANLSSAFQIKDTIFSDPSAFGYSVRLKNVTDGAEWVTHEVIKIGDRFGAAHPIVTFGCFDLIAELVETRREKTESLLLTKYNITGIKEGCETNYKEMGIPRVIVSVSTTLSGIVALSSAFSQWEEKYLAPAPKPVATTTTTAAAAGQDGSHPANTTTTTTTKPTQKTETTTEEPKMVEQIRKRTVKCKVAQDEQVPRPMTAQEIAHAKKRLNDFESTDVRAVTLAKARNTFESYVYATRSQLETDEIIEVSKEDERETLRLELSKAEEWLYEDGLTASTEEFDKSLRELEKKFDPITMRSTELRARAELYNVITKMKDRIEKVLNPPEALEKFELNATRRVTFQDEWTQFSVWMDQKKTEQEKKKLTETPAFSVLEAREKLKVLVTNFESLLRTGKIKPPPVRLNQTRTDGRGSEEPIVEGPELPPGQTASVDLETVVDDGEMTDIDVENGSPSNGEKKPSDEL